MNRLTVVVAGLLATLSTPITAQTQTSTAEKADNYIGLLGTYAIPDSARDAERGAGGHLYFGQALSTRSAIEWGGFGINIKRESDRDTDDFYYGLGANYFYSFRQDGLLNTMTTPFFIGGVGAFHDDVKRNRETTGQINAGLGVLLPIGSDRTRLRLEGRYYHVFSDDAPSQGDPTITDSDFGEVLLNVGLHIALRSGVNAVSDLDGDGVRDEKDKCPNTPKGVPVGADGCPADTDKDTVADFMDECPGTERGAEVNRQGCALDDDQDGVPNHKDKCPNTPRGEEVDLDGCSLPVSCPTAECDACGSDCDKDGVINQIDQCPGTLPGLKVNAVGCVAQAQTLVLQGVNFEFDLDRLTGDSKETLNRVAETLLGQPRIRVLIAGHTDSLGTDAYNMDLSNRRVASVVRYLLERGVSPQRLAGQGFGEREPIDTNNTEAGRLRNRRVEFRVLAPLETDR